MKRREKKASREREKGREAKRRERDRETAREWLGVEGPKRGKMAVCPGFGTAKGSTFPPR